MESPHPISFQEYISLRRKQKNSSSAQDFSHPTCTNEDYFCWRWSLYAFPHMMMKDTTQLPTDVTILQSLLENKELCGFLFESPYHNQDDNRIRQQLLDFYGDDPDRLVHMWSWAKASRIFESDHSWDRSVRAIRNRLRRLSFLRQLKRDEEYFFSHQNPFLPYLITLPKSDGDKSLGGEYEDGILEFLLARYNETVQRCVEEGLNNMKLAHEEDVYDSTFLQSSTDIRPVARAPPIVFSVPGSGKTQYILDHLSHQWGNYYVSGRIPEPKSLDTNETLLNARQGSASSDTRYLRDILDIIDSQDTKLHIKAWKRLVSNRESILRTILESTKTGENESHFTPRSWLLFQTSCTKKFDPFLVTFRIRLILEIDYISFDERIAGTPYAVPKKLYLPESMFFCLDEAQCELDDQDAGLEGFVSESSMSPLRKLLKFINKGLEPGSESNFIASGTALQLEKFKNVLESQVTGEWGESRTLCDILREDIPRAWAEPQAQCYKARIARTFRTIDSNDSFKELLEGHVFRIVDRIGYLIYLGDATNWYHLWEAFSIESPQMKKEEFYRELAARLVKLNHTTTQVKIKEAVATFVASFIAVIQGGDPRNEELLSKFWKPVQGRIRWSTILIERLLMGYLIQTRTREDAEVDVAELVKTASIETQNLITHQLKSRIKSLKSKDQHFLLRDLFLTAVRADLMNSPSIFPDTESVQMVTEGFALLKASENHATTGVTTASVPRAVRSTPAVNPSAPALVPSSAFSATVSTVPARTIRAPAPTVRAPAPGTITSSSGVGKQELAEPLVIKAVIEYLRENDAGAMHRGEQANRLEKVMEQLLFDHQNSAVGDIAEPYLGWALVSLLRRNTTSLMFPERKQSFVNLTRNANLIHRRNSTSLTSATLGDIGGYVILESSAVKNTKLEERMEFETWIQRIKAEEYFPTILFPSQYAGPDIVFMLQHQTEPTDKILCALQLKTGVKKSGLFNLIRTLDPNLWFSGTPRDSLAHHRALQQEFNEFGPNFRILTGLISPTKGNEVYRRGPDHLTELLQNLKGPAQLYTSLANEDDEASRQEIIQPLIADWESEITTRFKPKDKSKTDKKYWRGVVDNKLNVSNDHFGQTLGGESIVRIAVEELYSDDSLQPVPPIFQPRNGVQGRDFYFMVIQPAEVIDIFGSSLGKLAEIMKDE